MAMESAVAAIIIAAIALFLSVRTSSLSNTTRKAARRLPDVWTHTSRHAVLFITATL